jgi:hypothetical protein
MRKQDEVPMATQDSRSLYERLGGIYSIATVVDDLIDRVMADPRLNANPLVDDAHHKVPPAGFKYLVTEMLCWARGPQREARMPRALFALISFGLLVSSVVAQDRKGIRFWNLTLYTITSFQMSPAGKDSWGPDQCKNDRDGTVDHDERLRITGIEPGRYDVRLADKIGRVCIVRNVEVKDGAVFSIEEKQLTDCRG